MARSNTCRFRDTRLLKSEIHGMTPQVPEVFNFASILYTLNTHPGAPNAIPVCSTVSNFRDTRLSKIRNAPNDAD